MKRSGLPAIAGLVLCAAMTTAHAEDIAIVGATVHVAPGQVIEDGTVVIRGKSIAQVGKGIAVPAGARVIDGKGKIVTAGLIEASGRLGLVEVELVGATREGNFGDGRGSDVVHAAYQVIDGYNPRSVAIPVTRAHGVTSVIATPAGGLIAGRSAWLTLGDGGIKDVMVAASVAMYAQLGEGVRGSAEGSRGMGIMRLREVLGDALLYNRQKRSFERMQPLAASRLDLEALVPVAQGRMPLVVRAHRAADISAAVRLASELGLRLVIEGGTEAWMVAGELSAARIGVMVAPMDNLPASFDRVHVRDDLAKILADAGVDVVISTLGEASSVRTLRQQAGIAVANGLTWQQALAAVTTTPARLFGITRGALTAGAPADVVVWSGDPFELSSRAEHVIIGGKEARTRNRQTLLFERYRHLDKRPSR